MQVMCLKQVVAWQGNLEDEKNFAVKSWGGNRDLR